MVDGTGEQSFRPTRFSRRDIRPALAQELAESGAGYAPRSRAPRIEALRKAASA